jgi:hypothetical protein
VERSRRARPVVSVADGRRPVRARRLAHTRELSLPRYLNRLYAD